MNKAIEMRTGVEPRDRTAREEGTTDQRRKSLAERWVWWTGIKSEWLRSPEITSTIRLRLVVGPAADLEKFCVFDDVKNYFI